MHAPDLEDVLGGGRFTVTGSVYLDPMRPFALQPTIPSDHEKVKQKLISFEQIGGDADGYTYPEDANSGNTK